LTLFARVEWRFMADPLRPRRRPRRGGRFKTRLHDQDAETFVAEADGRLVGTLGVELRNGIGDMLASAVSSMLLPNDVAGRRVTGTLGIGPNLGDCRPLDEGISRRAAG
jgi:hypothetical protein